jgi:hypothetical protein
MIFENITKRSFLERISRFLLLYLQLSKDIQNEIY